MGFMNKDIISIKDFSKEDLIKVMETAKKIESMPAEKKQKLLDNKIMASLFLEPSTRTRLSFQAAMTRLGGKVIGFSDPKTASVDKGEDLMDTINTVENYCDIIVIRHPKEGSARLAAEVSKVPVINAGDGANQHPTQTMLDLYTIKKSQGRINNLNVAMVGDLKYGRTVHSLSIALSHFGCRQFFVSHPSLKMPDYLKRELDESKTVYYEHQDMMEVMDQIDILYMTRIQKERFVDLTEYERVKNAFILDAPMLKNAKKNMKILHPMPIVNEVTRAVDSTPYAHYFQQSANAVPVRQALICLLLGVMK